VRSNEDELNLEVNGVSFQQIHDSKYTEVINKINNKNCMLNKITCHLKAGNGCYFIVTSFQIKMNIQENQRNIVFHVFQTDCVLCIF
jgi:hypothetical protein